jgi:MutS domain I
MLCSLESLLTTLFIMFLQRCNSLTGFLYCPLVGPQRLSRYCSASYLRRSKAKITKINVLNAYRLCHTHDTILHADTDEYREATSSITSTSSLYEDDTSYLDHLKSDNKISKYWMQRLMQLPQGTARNLVSQLVPRNEVGYEATTGAAKKGSLVEFYIDQKIEHPDKVILMRNGEFYETFGIDALMLIAYCGLNPMGGKPKAGCPIQNVQATLDGLTNQGFSAAVYEESPESESSSGVKSKIKTRGLSQIVFPGAKMYTHDLSMRPDNIDFPENHPVVGIMKTVDGYTIVQIYLDEQTMDISQRLTLETVRVLAEGRFVQPIYLEGNCKKDVLGSHVDSVTITGCTEDDFPDQVLRNFAKAVPGTNIDDFKKRRKSYMNGPRPVYISTSLQIGQY